MGSLKTLVLKALKSAALLDGLMYFLGNSKLWLDFSSLNIYCLHNLLYNGIQSIVRSVLVGSSNILDDGDGALMHGFPT